MLTKRCSSEPLLQACHPVLEDESSSQNDNRLLCRSANAFAQDWQARQQGGASSSQAPDARSEPSAASTSGDGAEVAVIMGSDSDLPTMRAAAEVLRDFGIRCRVTVVSAHRTPERMVEFARNAHRQGVKASLFILSCE